MKEKVQVFGRFLSGMVMPNIGAFIAWGLITALFIPTGWYPNEAMGALVSPMASMLLPLLIGCIRPAGRRDRRNHSDGRDRWFQCSHVYRGNDRGTCQCLGD